jgi:hypothetical protein
MSEKSTATKDIEDILRIELFTIIDSLVLVLELRPYFSSSMGPAT